MKQINNNGFSIVVALGLILLLSFTGLYIVEYTIPYARSVKGIEQASQAFFESYSGIENALYDIKTGDIGDEFNETQGGFEYLVSSKGLISPPAGSGTSEYTNDWNALSKNNPIQLLVGKGRISPTSASSFIRMNYQVIGNQDQNTLKISGGNDEMILWQISSSNSTLYTKPGDLITESEINNIGTTNLWSQDGVQGDGTNESFKDFYARSCSGATEECVLKISVIRDIISKNDEIQPYVEYQITTSQEIPTRFARITSNGKSYGFTKKLELKIPQQTTNSAFDFTIFQ